MKMKLNTENLSFENALEQLETLVKDLEGGRIKLDDAVESYEKAVALKKFCEEKLKAAQLKIEKIETSVSDEPMLTLLDKIDD
ncbi:MAG: exodeoxyribonuclease VII small subunit [Alphaproteobacteria bacterium]|nr:exodeoxyribonuclease VII small subunit [Alphaproteobacteria bacterium]